MFSMQLNVRERDLRKLGDATNRFNKSFDGRLATVMNRTARFTATYMVDEIVGKVVLKPANVKSHGKKNGKQKQVYQSLKATARRLRAQAKVRKLHRYGLEKFGKAKQNGTGTAYQIDRSGGQKVAIGAFMGPKPNRKAPKLHGAVFKRVGKARLPIARKKGASVWGVATAMKLKMKAKRFAKRQMQREIHVMINKLLRENGFDTVSGGGTIAGLDFLG